MISITIILTLSLLFIYLTIVLNAKFLWLNHAYYNHSLLTGNDSSLIVGQRVDNKLLDFFGRLIAKSLPKNFIEQYKYKHYYLERAEFDLYSSLSLALLSFIVLFACFFLSSNFIFLLLALLMPIIIFYEIDLAVSQAYKEIEENIDHVVKCLRVLIVKTETPIINALELIVEDLPDDLIAIRRELLKIINKAKKSGIKITLKEWQTDLTRFKDFISLLISVNEGTSKHALELNLSNFIKKIDEDKAEVLRSHADNLQLYLMGPVVLMLLVAMLPMTDAISFLMENSGVFGG